MIYRIELVKGDNIILERNFSGDAPIIEKNKFMNISDVYFNMVLNPQIIYSLYYLDEKLFKRARRKGSRLHQSKILICQYHLDPINLEFYTNRICNHYMLKTNVIR